MKEDIAEIKTNVKHILNRIDKMEDTFATKSDIGFVQVAVVGITGALAYVYKLLLGGN